MLELLVKQCSLQQNDENHSLEEAMEQLTQFIGHHYGNEDVVFTMDWGKKFGKTFMHLFGNGQQYVSTIMSLKEIIWASLEEAYQSTSYSSKELLQAIQHVDRLFGYLVEGINQAVMEVERKKTNTIRSKYLKLSTPIVPIMDHVAVFPIIGELDEMRSEIIIEETLKQTSNLDIEWLIIDLSGVYDVDDLFIQSFNRLLESLKILGVSPVLTGMRPDLSMRAVKMGMTNVTNQEYQTKSSLKQAVEMFLRDQHNHK